MEDRRIGPAGFHVLEAYCSADNPASPGWDPCTGCSSCIWSPSSTRLFAHRAMAMALARATCPASSMNRKSSAPSHSGLVKSQAVPPMTPPL